jgi:putative redox protein
MKVFLKSDINMRVKAFNENNLETVYDSPIAGGGESSATSPMEAMLQTLGACSYMDMISILRKKRKTISDFNMEIDAKRAEEHPKVFTEVFIKISVISPDATLEDIKKAAELSYNKYCSVAAMFKASGCRLDYSCEIISPSEIITK